MTPKIVAEVSGNHGGKLENCLKLIDEAKKLKVDCIKFQSFSPSSLARRRARSHLGEQYSFKTLRKLYQETHTPFAWWKSILTALDSYPWSCSVFSLEDLTLMEHYGCPNYKIASFEATDLDLIRAVANTGKPLVISFNDTHQEVDVNNAYEAAHRTPHLTFLYATPYDNSDMIEDYERAVWLSMEAPMWVDIGLSDHSAPGDASLVQKCVSDWLIGMVERHICLPDIQTPDVMFSDTPEQFSHYIQAIRNVSPVEARTTDSIR